MPKPLIGGKQKQRSRVALGHTVAAVFPMRPSFSVGITEEEAKGLPVQLISQPSLQRAEQPSAKALPRQSVQLHHAGLDALLQTDALIQVTGLPAVISRAVFAAHIVGTVAKAAADASAAARLVPMLPPADGRACPDPAHISQSVAGRCGSAPPAYP